MKLASLKEGGRDGTLVVVDGDLSRAARVPGIASTLQAALDRWAEVAPLLQEASRGIGSNPDAFSFDPRACASPFPRAYQRSEEHTTELQSLMRISYAVFCLKKNTNDINRYSHNHLATQRMHNKESTK